MKPIGMTDEVYKRYQNDGFTQDEIEKIWQRTLKTREQMKLNLNREPREITSSTYERAQNKLNKKVNDWFGLNRR